MLHFWRALKLPDLFPNLLSPVTIITRGTTSRRASAADQPLLPAGQAPSRTLPEPPRTCRPAPSPNRPQDRRRPTSVAGWLALSRTLAELPRTLIASPRTCCPVPSPHCPASPQFAVPASRCRCIVLRPREAEAASVVGGDPPIARVGGVLSAGEAGERRTWLGESRARR
jgi:hypothetical protein